MIIQKRSIGFFYHYANEHKNKSMKIFLYATQLLYCIIIFFEYFLKDSRKLNTTVSTFILQNFFTNFYEFKAKISNDSIYDTPF